MTIVGNEDAWSHKIIKALARGPMICPHVFPTFFSKREALYRASITPFYIRSQAMKRDLSSLALSNTYNTHQGLCDDCPRSWPDEHFNLPGCVNQDIPVPRKTIKEVLHLYNAENVPLHKTPNYWLSKIGIPSSQCQVYHPPVVFEMHTTFPQALFNVQYSC